MPITTSLRQTKQGFTLIELSIVLVIIGLIVGGVLVGQDLITAAAVRAQISQIEKYNTAVNTFRVKYGGLPGDLALISANQFGFDTAGCDGTASSRDGNGFIDGYPGFVLGQGLDETTLFWKDLSAANLIDGSIPNGGGTVNGCWGVPSFPISQTMIGNFFPAAKIGNGNFLYVYETGGSNWFGFSRVTAVNSFNAIVSTTGLSVMQAYNIDKKIDDGMPVAGNIVAVYLGNGGTTTTVQAPNTGTSGGNASSCYDTTSNTYSTGQNGGAGFNCALSFKMQGAAR